MPEQTTPSAPAPEQTAPSPAAQAEMVQRIVEQITEASPLAHSHALRIAITALGNAHPATIYDDRFSIQKRLANALQAFYTVA